MKLNPDCIRDLMLTLEEITWIIPGPRYVFNAVNCGSLSAKFKGTYDAGEIAYTLIQLAESGYIKMQYKCEDYHRILNMGDILYVTPKGHEFISQIQDKERWTTKIKPAVRLFGNVSLSIIEAISKGAANAALDRIIPNRAEP